MRELFESFESDNSAVMELLVFITGAAAYGLTETLFRGYTHWTMLITGGACVLTFYLLLDWLMAMPLVLAALAGAVIITCYEFAVGMLVNVGFHWNVWDYSAMTGNVMGQICPAFSMAWFGLCFMFFAVIKVFS